MIVTKQEIINILDEIKEKNIEEEMNIEKIKEYVSTQNYGLNFERTTEDIENELKTYIPILKEEKEKELWNGKGFFHFLIEGENLCSLKVLEQNSPEIIDVIYIDPPYNTRKNFVYTDKKQNGTNSYRHSEWLSFMEKRLIIAKKLLNEKGIIFISIDEHESAHLKLLCDTIFGEENYISEFIWKKSHGGSTLPKFVRSNCESILCYAKNLKKIDFDFFSEYVTQNGDSPLANASNKYTSLVFPPYSVEFKSMKDGIIPSFKKIDSELHNDIIIENGFNKNTFVLSNHWKWQQTKLENELQNGTILISKTKELKLRYKKKEIQRIIKPTQLITNDDGVGYTLSGSTELKNIIHKKFFDYPKPVSLIKYLINMVTYQNPNAIILDFFAGSGTTGQAVLELNKEDNGNRQFILCTNNENNICEEITYERLKTVITGIRSDGTNYSNRLNGNLKYFKSELIPKE